MAKEQKPKPVTLPKVQPAKIEKYSKIETGKAKK